MICMKAIVISIADRIQADNDQAWLAIRSQGSRGRRRRAAGARQTGHEYTPARDDMAMDPKPPE